MALGATPAWVHYRRVERAWWSGEPGRGDDVVRKAMSGRHAAEVAVTAPVAAAGGPAGGATAPAAGGPLATDTAGAAGSPEATRSPVPGQGTPVRFCTGREQDKKREEADHGDRAP